MIVFFTRNIEGTTAFLEAEEARHAAQVLRRQPGDMLRFTDGQGAWYDGVIEETGKKGCKIRIVERSMVPERRPYKVTLAVAPTKNAERFEWFLEKATEIGIDRIIPIWCKHAERTHLRPERLEKILISAMKQSLQPFLPRLEPAVSLDRLLRQEQDAEAARFIAYVDAADNSPHLFEVCPPGRDTLVLIGPEGDFAKDEVEAALQAGFLTVSLGPNRLRTETAAVAAVHTIALRNELTIIDP